MSENHKIEIEGLMNAVLDDEASERQKTEFKRMLRHDPDISKQYESLKRQKQLLNALPVETAPADLVEDVTSVLQRHLILNEVEQPDSTSVSGASHLAMRRLLTNAAMLLLPLGLLSLVVYQIMKPASEGPMDYVSTNQVLDKNHNTDLAASGQPAVSQQLPFDGILTFRTNQQMTVSNYAEKMIFDLGLIGSTVPSRTMDVTTYQITTSPEKVSTLIDSLKNVWPRCQEVTLSVVDSSNSNLLDVPDVQAEQVKTLAMEDNHEMLNITAKQYALANKHRKNAFARVKENTVGSGDNMPPLSIPIPTGRYETKSKPVDPSQPTVRLRIHIKRAME